LAAAAAIAHQRGIRNVTVPMLCSAARISNETFHSYFFSVSHCYESALAEAFGVIFGSLDRPIAAGRWRADLGDVLAVLFRSIADSPLLAELCLVHSRGAEGGLTHLGYDRVVQALTRILRQLDNAEGPAPVPPVPAELLAASVVSYAANRIVAGGAHELPEAKDEMTAFITSYFPG
jgi:AcrR family transcriptional regulator